MRVGSGLPGSPLVALIVLLVDKASVRGVRAGTVRTALLPPDSGKAYVISEVAPSEGVMWWNQSHTLPREPSGSASQGHGARPKPLAGGDGDGTAPTDYLRGYAAGLRSCRAGAGDAAAASKLPSASRRDGLALGGGSLFLVIAAGVCGYRCRRGSRSQGT